MKNYDLEEIRDAASAIAIRLKIGEFLIRGERSNVMELESRVSWETVVAQLHNEGFVMVHPEEYAQRYGLSADTVLKRVEEGSMFALTHSQHEEMLMVVPLDEREEPKGEQE